MFKQLFFYITLKTTGLADGAFWLSEFFSLRRMLVCKSSFLQGQNGKGGLDACGVWHLKLGENRCW